MSDANERLEGTGDLPVTPRQLLFATIGHVLVGALLVFGVQCTPKPPEEVVIQAVLLEEPVEGEKPVTVKEAVKPKPPEPKPPEPKPEPPKPEPPKPEPPKPKPEPPKPDPEKLRKEAEAAEKKRIEDVVKKQEQILLSQQKAEEQRRIAEEQAKVVQEKARAEADAKAKREAAEEVVRQQALLEEQNRLKAIEDAKRKAAEAVENKRKAEEKARAEALAAQLAAEENARMAAIRADSQKLWARALAEALRRNWLRQPGSDGFVCKVKIRMLPNGQVINASIVNSCGSTLLDDSVIAAANKASPLPLPSEPSAFVPEVTITFRP